MASSVIAPEVDVCLVGLGGVGGLAAYTLTRAGRRVVALEAGPPLDGREYVMDELHSSMVRNTWGAAKFNHEIPTWRPNAQTPIQPFTPSHGLMSNGVGGSSPAYGAISFRFHPDDFRVRTNTIARYGAGALPPGTDITDWPITYDEVEPYYDVVERLIGVAGQTGNLRGQTVPGGNPFEGPRAHPYPLPALRRSGLGELFSEKATQLGYHPFPVPAAIATEPYHGRHACTYCSFCSRLACHVGAKGDVRVTVLPHAMATGNLEIRTGCRVLQLVTNDHGEVIGVEYQGPSGRVLQPAGVVILSAFTFENVRLLLLSRSRRFPQGLGNNTGQVGKYFMPRQLPAVQGILEEHTTNRFIGPQAQAQAIDDWNADNFDHTGLGFIRGAYMAVHNTFPPITSSAVLPPGVRRWGRDYKHFLARDYNRIVTVVYMSEVLPYEANTLDLDPDARDSMGRPVLRITFDISDNERRATNFLQDKAAEILDRMGVRRVWRLPAFSCALSQHDVGGTRMGTDPLRSVVDSFGRVHEAPRVFVLSGSNFPTLPGLNPTLTIQALGIRTAAHIAGTTLDALEPHP